MMRPGRRASLLVALYMLTSAATELLARAVVRRHPRSLCRPQGVRPLRYDTEGIRLFKCLRPLIAYRRNALAIVVRSQESLSSIHAFAILTA